MSRHSDNRPCASKAVLSVFDLQLGSEYVRYYCPHYHCHTMNGSLPPDPQRVIVESYDDSHVTLRSATRTWQQSLEDLSLRQLSGGSWRHYCYLVPVQYADIE